MKHRGATGGQGVLSAPSASELVIVDATKQGAPRILRPPPKGADRSEAMAAKEFLQSVIDKFVVVIYASVSVRYSGRASSVANSAPRLVITKPDGSLLVHEGRKNRPMNWQPPGTKFDLSVQGPSPKLILEAFRKKDREVIILYFDKLFFITASGVGEGTFRFSGSESDMVEEVIRTPEMVEEGFVPIEREFRTPYGSVDLVGRDKDGNILLLEFKRRRAQLSSVSQLDRYVTYFSLNSRQKVRGGVVAPSATKEALELLKEKGYRLFELKPKVF